jgi:amino acid adenylation domain-containing protein
MVSVLHEWITGQAQHRGEAIALVMNEERLTYGQLEEESNRLARLLKAVGCRKGDRVGFLMPKSPAAIISLLGILKADCIYVPLDPASPAERLARIVASCEPRCLLAAGAVTKPIEELMAMRPSPGAAGTVRPLIGWMGRSTVAPEGFSIEFTRSDAAAWSAEPLDYQNTSEDTAHILFTSGSTGVPKGVMIKHSNVIHYIEWAIRYFGTSQQDRISGHPPLHFDLSTFDLFGTFAAGAQLHLVSAELNLLPNKLAEFMRSSELTQWFSVPSLLNYMAKLDVVKPHDFPALQRLLWCGEVFPTPGLRYWMQRLPHVSFTNLYGPTEATIASSYYTVPECPPDDSSQIPIGRACAGEKLLVLDDHLQPVATGEIGNLYIGGVGLSPGYWRDPDKTSASFVQNPRGSDANDRLYRTGDLARLDGDGLVYFAGRADTQIKSRGYRIELGEIETALNALGLLQDCAVVAIDAGGFEGATICCAYVPLADIPITPMALRRAVSKKLPAYMLPARWMRLRHMPLNVNGKYDRRKIGEMLQAELTKAAW